MATGKPNGPQLIALPGGRSASKYDESEFLVGGRGVGRGEIDSVTFKIHEGYVAELEKWVRSKKFPYKYLSDIVRHAVVRHVKQFLPSLEGEVEGSLLHELDQIDEVVARWTFQNNFIKHIENIAEQVNATLAMPNGKVEVGRMLASLKLRIDATRYSYHKGVYQKMFMERFGAHLPDRPHLLEIRAAEYDGDDVDLPAELMQEPNVRDDDRSGGDGEDEDDGE